jgi:hypothetical protein
MAKSPIPPAPLRSPPAQPHQLSMALDSISLRGMSPSEREKVLTHLASLLLLAAGAATGEPDDAEH